MGFYSYEAKYTDGRADHIVPAELPDAVTEACLDMALAAHRALGCTGVSRADFPLGRRPSRPRGPVSFWR